MVNFIKNFEISFYRRDRLEPYLTIDSDQPTPLRIVFNIKKKATQNNTANSMSLQIYNLSKATRDMMLDFGDIVRVRGGWRGKPLSTLFQGYSTAVSHVISMPNTVSSIMCLDGDFNWMATHRINISASTQIKTLINETAAQLRLIVAVNMVPDDAVLQSGYVSDDKNGRDVLSDLANRAACTAYMEDGDLYVVPQGYSLNTVHDVSESTGMIGYPDRLGYNLTSNNFVANTINPISWRVRTQLDGSIKISQTLKITCPPLDIENLPVYSRAIVHEGDSYGALWATTVEGAQVKS